MRLLRQISRLILLILWCIVMFFYGGYLHLISLFDTRYEKIKRLTYGAKIWGTGIAKIANLQIKIHGDPNIVKGMIISNHLSYLDIIILSSVFPLRFTPKADIAKWPFLGWFVWLSMAIWVDRERRQSAIKTMQEFIETISHSINLMTFPEGTTTDGTNGLLPFKSTVFEVVTKRKTPLYPVLIHYKEDSKNLISWYGNVPFIGHAWNVLGIPKIIADLHILSPIVSKDSDNRKTLAMFVHKFMDNSYRKLYNE